MIAKLSTCCREWNENEWWDPLHEERKRHAWGQDEDSWSNEDGSFCHIVEGLRFWLHRSNILAHWLSYIASALSLPLETKAPSSSSLLDEWLHLLPLVFSSFFFVELIVSLNLSQGSIDLLMWTSEVCFYNREREREKREDLMKGEWWWWGKGWLYGLLTILGRQTNFSIFIFSLFTIY